MRRLDSVGARVRFGLLTVAVWVGAFYLAFGGPLPFRGGYEVEAVVSSVTELRADSPVRVAGVQVGEVVEVRRGEGATGVVRMRIDDGGRPLHRDATLKVRPRLFLEGNFFVDLHPGTPQAPELEDGGRIPLGQTAIPVQLDQVLSALRSDTRTSLRQTLDGLGGALDDGGAQALRATFGPLRGAMAGAAVLAEEARGQRPDDLAALVVRGERVVRAFAERRRDLAGLVTGLRRTTDALADRRGALTATVRGLDGLLEQAPAALADLNRAIPSVRRLAGDLRPVLRRASTTLDLGTPLLREAGRLLADDVLPGLVRDGRPAVRDLERLRPELQELLRKVEPVASCVHDQALPVLVAKLDDGELSTGLPAWRELMTGLVGLASASQSFDANGPAVRYLATFGESLVSSGQLPSLTRLVSQQAVPLVGSRPAKTAQAPPFRPDVECATQPPVDLRARTAPPAPTTEVRAAAAPSLTEVRALLRELRATARRVGR
ncbi:MlaD family protein [Conexibacter sp. SYSU D00693]|uniref:MlaD family protein n=1 Tax=Conexibacter sp. SYSU D00693 TaxID=2812560 RepID=UPI00196B8E41|nr:MlaD family protein [Conexibacter sp. SYSU D00693]